MQVENRPQLALLNLESQPRQTKN